MTTTNLSDFGHRELEMLEELLRAMREQGLPNDFCDDEVHPMMNKNSGNVFLTNSDYQVAMMNGDTLESWYFLSYHGNEGFLDELLIDYENENIMQEDWEQLADICEVNGRDEKAQEIRDRINSDEVKEMNETGSRLKIYTKSDNGKLSKGIRFEAGEKVEIPINKDGSIKWYEDKPKKKSN